MLKFKIILLITLFSCQQSKNNDENVFYSKDKAIAFAISSLKELDKLNDFNIYYVIETSENLLYVINTNKKNRVPFMYFFDTIDCESINESEFIINLIRESDNPQRDNCVGKGFNLPSYFGDKIITELNGVIFKKTEKNNSPIYTEIKKGNILSEVKNDPYLIIKESIEDVPINSCRYNE